MSEYQLYEFLALDRPLSAEDLAYVRTLSSRVQPTPTQATFIYSYSSFPGDPLKLLAKHYDKVSPQKTSCRRLHISEERDEPVLSDRMGWHGSFNWPQNYASGTIRKLKRWRLICIRLRKPYWSG